MFKMMTNATLSKLGNKKFVCFTVRNHWIRSCQWFRLDTVFPEENVGRTITRKQYVWNSDVPETGLSTIKYIFCLMSHTL